MRQGKAQKGKVWGGAYRGVTSVLNGYGLEAVEAGRLADVQLKTALRLLIKELKLISATCAPLVRVSATVPITKKALEVRMGQGKGPIVGYIRRIRAGTIILELPPVLPEALAIKMLKAVQYKIGFRTQIRSYR